MRGERVRNCVIFKDILWLRGCKRVRKSINAKDFNKALGVTAPQPEGSWMKRNGLSEVRPSAGSEAQANSGGATLTLEVEKVGIPAI